MDVNYRGWVPARGQSSACDDAKHHEEQRRHQGHQPDEPEDPANGDSPELARIEVPGAALSSGVGRCGMETLRAPPENAGQHRPDDEPKRPGQQDSDAKAQSETGLRGHH